MANLPSPPENLLHIFMTTTLSVFKPSMTETSDTILEETVDSALAIWTKIPGAESIIVSAYTAAQIEMAEFDKGETTKDQDLYESQLDLIATMARRLPNYIPELIPHLSGFDDRTHWALLLAGFVMADKSDGEITACPAIDGAQSLWNTILDVVMACTSDSSPFVAETFAWYIQRAHVWLDIKPSECQQRD